MNIMHAPSIKEWNHPLALASDPGQCGKVLRKLQSSILHEAAQRKDTWDFLLGLKKLPEEVYQFCHAAKSAQYGAYRLARMARGIATPRSDCAEKYAAAVRDGHTRRIQQLESKILLHTERALPGRLEASALDGLQTLVRAKVVAERTRLARRMGRRKAMEFLSSQFDTAALAHAAQEQFPREWLLITGWLRLPNSDPGLCFFTKTALAWLFHNLGFSIHQSTDPYADTRNRLRRLKLVQAQALVRGVTKTPDGVIVLTIGREQHPLKTHVRTGARIRY